MSGEQRIRILHISDLHARGSRDGKRAWKRRQVLGEAWQRNLDEIAKDGQRFDLVAFTGDVADRGLADDYMAATPFVEELLKHLHVGRDRLFVVPGNHDVHRHTEAEAWAGLREGISKLPQDVSEWMAGSGDAPFRFTPEWRDAVLEREREFWNWVEHELGRSELLPRLSPHGRLGYRVSLRLGDQDVHVIGLDSAWLAGDDADAGRLWLTDDQLGLLCKDAHGDTLPGVRLALVHHPLSDLADAGNAGRLLADNVDLLLRGHQHTPIAHAVSDPDRAYHELAAGCLYEGSQGNRYPNACQVIDVTIDAGGRAERYDIRFRAWSMDGYHWHDDGALYREAEHGRLTWRVTLDKAKPGRRHSNPVSEPRPDPVAQPRPAPYRCMATPLEAFVPRGQIDELVAHLGEAAAAPTQATVGITTALQGAGGFGKTTLARALCFDERVRAFFPDGILFTTLGEGIKGQDRVARVLDLVRWWRDREPPDISELSTAVATLRQDLTSRRVLLVVDDVWQQADLTPFLGLGVPVLATTRNRDTLPRRNCRAVNVDAMKAGEATDLLGLDLNIADADRAPLERLAARLGRWPLLLDLVGRHLHGLVREDGLSVSHALIDISRTLDRKGLTAFEPKDPSARNQAVRKTIEVSLERLADDERRCYEMLAVFPDDVDIPLPVLAQFWWPRNPDMDDTRNLCQRLRALSLVQRFDYQHGTVRLHDVFRQYLVEGQGKSLPRLHERWLDTFRPSSGSWPDLPTAEPYAWRFLAYHLVQAERTEALVALLSDFDWMDGKLHALVNRMDEGGGIAALNALVRDFAYLADDADRQSAPALVRDALRLSSHVLARDPTQLPGQLVSRLARLEQAHSGGNHAIVHLLDHTRRAARYMWLRPRRSNLTAPGGSQILTLAGHDSAVWAVAMTPDGKHVVSASSDKTLKLWDLDSGSEIRTLVGHRDWVLSVAITPDGKRAISASQDQTLKVWDLDSGSEIRTLTGHQGWVLAVAVAPDGKRVISASRDRTLTLWDLDSGSEIRTFAGHKDAVNAVTVTPDGKRAISASHDLTLRVWDLNSGSDIYKLVGHVSFVLAVAVSPDGNYAISASHDQTLKLWDLNSGSEIRTFTGHESEIWGVVVTPDGKHAVSASHDRTLKLWDLDSGSEIRTLAGHDSTVLAVAATPNGKRIVSASHDRTLKLWDLGSGSESLALPGHNDWIRAVAVSPDGKCAVSASRDRTLKLWDLDSGSEIRTLTGHDSFVLSVAVTPDGKQAISASHDRTLKLWNLASGFEIRTFAGHDGAVWGVAVSPDGKRAISASQDQTLKVWDLDSGSEIQTLSGHRSEVWAVAISPNGKRVISASQNGTLKLWDLDSGSEIWTLSGHGSSVWAVAISPDGKRVISASQDRTLKLWDLERGSEIQTLAGHDSPVWAVSVTPDSKRCISASQDRTLKLWDLDSGALLATFTADGAVTACTVASAGHLFVAGDTLGHIHLLELIEPGHGTTTMRAG